MFPITEIPVVWWSNRHDVHPAEQWDSGMLHWLFHNELWDTHYQFQYGQSAPTGGVAVVIVAARHHVDDVGEINHFIAGLSGVVLILLGDEEATFPWQEIVHPNIRFWVMMPSPAAHGGMIDADGNPWAFFFGTGCKVDTVFVGGADKDVAWAFAGQATHPRRIQAVNGLRRLSARVDGELLPTKSFTAGLDRGQYLDLLRRTKVAPCPSGPKTADSMRLYEALEAGCLPIVDTGPEGGSLGYWEMLYGPDHPLIVTHDWGSVGGIVEAEISKQRWPRNANLVSSWWMAQKRRMARRMVSDLQAVGAPKPELLPTDKLTVVITTSPIPSHPSMEILEQTMASFDHSLGGKVGFDGWNVQTIITCDGVRPEQRHLAEGYDEYVRQLCWKAQQEWANVQVIVSKEHRHQAGMLKLALAEIDTPVMLLVEHDAPFSTEPADTIDWLECIDLIDYGALDILRFHHEAQIHPEHERLMLDHQTVEMLGVPLRRTRQYSARPHLARTDYYRAVMAQHFPEGSNCFIEDKLHGIVENDPSHRVAVYHPEGSIRRTLHTDGRAGEKKYDDLQRFS